MNVKKDYRASIADAIAANERRERARQSEEVSKKKGEGNTKSSTLRISKDKLESHFKKRITIDGPSNEEVKQISEEIRSGIAELAARHPGRPPKTKEKIEQEIEEVKKITPDH